MIKYSVRRVINSNINLPRHRLNNEKWKLRETKRGEKVAAEQREDIRAQYSLESPAWTVASSKSPVGRLPLSCASNRSRKTMGRQRKEGRGKMADERNEMMERRKHAARATAK